jgi:anti-sigma B factor antagonist
VSAKPHPSRPDLGNQESLRCDVLPERDHVRVRPVGTLDLANAPVLEKQLSELRDAGFAELIVDLRRLAFMDSSGLRLLLRWHAESRSNGFRLTLVQGAPEIQRVFDLTGMTDKLPFIDAA